MTGSVLRVWLQPTSGVYVITLFGYITANNHKHSPVIFGLIYFLSLTVVRVGGHCLSRARLGLTATSLEGLTFFIAK